jgi:hypothetical protein
MPSDKTGTGERGTVGGNTVPIRAIDVGPVRFEMWAEEARAKGKLPAS